MYLELQLGKPLPTSTVEDVIDKAKFESTNEENIVYHVQKNSILFRGKYHCYQRNLQTTIIKHQNSKFVEMKDANHNICIKVYVNGSISMLVFTVSGCAQLYSLESQ